MKSSLRQFKQILLITSLLFCTAAVIAQSKMARDNKSFSKITARASVSFTLPDGFKELPVIENSNYDYGMNLPDQDFEIWFKISPAAENSSDSLYVELAKTQLKQLAGDNNSLARNLPERVLTDYNADAGKTYFISLPDLQLAKQFKYALLITLQKNHKGNIIAVCLTNDKGPDFFKNIEKARNCIKFKAGS